jgi:hypothetical protein
LTFSDGLRGFLIDIPGPGVVTIGTPNLTANEMKEVTLTSEQAALCRVVLSQSLMKVSRLLGKGIDGSGNPLDADSRPGLRLLERKSTHESESDS